MDIEQLQDRIKEFGIPNVDFSKLKLSTATALVEAIEVMINKYPALKNSICSIGNDDYINNQCNLIQNSNRYKKIEWNEFTSTVPNTILSAISRGSNIPYIKGGEVFELKQFIALIYHDYIEKMELDCLDEDINKTVKYGFHPKHCTTFKSIVYHEFGHILEYVLNLSRDKNIYELIKSKSNNFLEIKNKVSIYAIQSNLSEIIAEIFAEYIICPDSNDLINAVGKYIDEKYKKYENTRLFMINHKFKFDNSYSSLEKQTSHKK